MSEEVKSNLLDSDEWQNISVPQQKLQLTIGMFCCFDCPDNFFFYRFRRNLHKTHTFHLFRNAVADFPLVPRDATWSMVTWVAQVSSVLSHCLEDGG